MLATGILAIVMGVGLLSIPAALIVLGVALTALAISEAVGDVVPSKVRRPKG
jgi:hypothetical protein